MDGSSVLRLEARSLDEEEGVGRRRRAGKASQDSVGAAARLAGPRGVVASQIPAPNKMTMKILCFTGKQSDIWKLPKANTDRSDC